jgi:hypothetical protein
MIEHLLAKIEVIQANMDDNQEMMAKMNAKMDAWIEEMEACVGKLEANPVKSDAIVKHREFPKEKAAVKPVGALSKHHGDWHLAVECCQKPKKRTQGTKRIWPPPAEG